MTLVIILDLIHLAAWSDLPSPIKHIYYLPTRGNIVGVLKFNLLDDVESILCEWWLDVEMVGIIWIFLLLSHKTVCRHCLWWLHNSGWYFCITKQNKLMFVCHWRTDIVVNSIADDVWVSEDELTGVLSDNVESWYWLWL